MNNQAFHKIINQEFNLSGKDLKEIDAFKDYWINSGNYENLKENSKQIISSYYNDKIEKNKAYISQYINSGKIEQIITPVSFSYMKKSVIDELPIQKSLKVFPNIKTIILLYTDDTEKRGMNLKKTLEDEYKVEIYLERIEDSETSLRRLQKKYEFSKEKTVIDITLGPKITSIQLYKLAVEADINVINWVEPYKPVVNIEGKDVKFHKEKIFRVSLKTSLERMMQPAIESMKKKKKLNEDLKKWDFKEVANYYSTSGNETFEKVFRHLAQIINLDSLMIFDFSSLKEKCKLLVEDLIQIQLKKHTDTSSDITNWINNFIVIFTIVTKNRETIETLLNEGEKYIEGLDENDSDDDQAKELLKKIFKDELEEKKETRISKEKDFLYTIFYNNNDLDIKKDDNINILKWILIEFVRRNISNPKLLNKIIVHPELQNELLNNKTNNLRKFVIEQFEKLEKEALQKIENYTITFEKGIINIPKFNIKIDLMDFDEFKSYFYTNKEPKKLYMKALKELIKLNRSDSSLTVGTPGQLFGNDKSEATLAKDKTYFGNEIATPLNIIISKKIPIKSGKKEDLIIIETNRIILNKFYYTYE